MSTPTAIALAGCGYWGSKWARNIADCPRSRLALLCDPDQGRAEALSSRYGSQAVTDFSHVVADEAVDAVLLATPGDEHFSQARAALEAGKDVLIEKPMTLTAADADHLTRLAADRGRVLMSGHTFLFSEPVRALKRLIAGGRLGRVLYAYTQRLGFGAFRHDMDATWDLAPHDLSIFLHLVGEPIVAVQASKFSLIDDPQADIGFLTVHFADGAIGHIHNSRLDPRKVRLVTVVGDQGMAVYDDTDVDAPLRIYDRSAQARELAGRPDHRHNRNVAQFHFDLRDGDVVIPKLPAGEPLREELEHFLDCIAGRKTPLSDGRFGERIASILEAADRSSEQGGTMVEIADQGQVRG